jgi:hypothetical protein
MRSDEQMLPIVAVKITTLGKHVTETITKENKMKLHTSGVGCILNPVSVNFSVPLTSLATSSGFILSSEELKYGPDL